MVRMTRRPTLLLAVLLAMTACDQEPLDVELEETAEELAVTDPDAALVSALESISDDFGLTDANSLASVAESDESPAFGSAVFAQAFAEPDAPQLASDVASDTEIASLPPERVRIYNVMALWGRLRPTANTEWSPLQWDPALQVAEGDMVRVRREILFEQGDEVHPQEERNLVTMTSWTGPHIDGVTAQVAIKAPDGVIVSPTDEFVPSHEQFFSFRSTPWSVKIAAAELGDLHVAEILDDTGNGVLLAALRRPPVACGVGFMKGRWARTSERGGVFGGLWVQANGNREGYLAGRWGLNDTGERVFHAKIVNLQGQFLARMAGTYGNGVYEGEIYGRGRVLLGFVKGRYTGEDGHGSFLGGWRQVCVSDTPPRTCRLTDDGIRVCLTPARPEQPTG